MCLVENAGKEAQRVAEVLCIPKAIPEHTVYQIRGIRVCAYCRVSSSTDEQLHSFDAQYGYYSNYIQKNEKLGSLPAYMRMRELQGHPTEASTLQ